MKPPFPDGIEADQSYLLLQHAESALVRVSNKVPGLDSSQATYLASENVQDCACRWIGRGTKKIFVSHLVLL